VFDKEQNSKELKNIMGAIVDKQDVLSVIMKKQIMSSEKRKLSSDEHN